MSSRRQNNRSRSPRRDGGGPSRSQSRRGSSRPGGDRAYRERDYDDCPRYDSGYRSQDDQGVASSQFFGSNLTVTVNNYNFSTARPDNVPAARRGGRGNLHGFEGDRNHSEDRGRSRTPRSRDVSRASQNPHELMPPPSSTAPLDPKRGRQGQDDRPKKIPDKLRDKCGACRQDHDIRFCPEPNTRGLQTKICPICDTSKHAWHQCWHYDPKDKKLQFIVLWMNRRGNTTLVHNVSLNEVLLEYAHASDEEGSFEARLEAINKKAGPLTRDFVRQLMPPASDDDPIARQILGGRQVPWEMKKKVLESNERRPDKALVDPATKRWNVGDLIDSRTPDNPKAEKLEYFREQDKKNKESFAAAKANSEISNESRRLDLASNNKVQTLSSASRRSGRSMMVRRNMLGAPAPMKVVCANCGSDGHVSRLCPDPCKQCGFTMSIHFGFTGYCAEACVCRENAGHLRDQCDRLCRLCVIQDRQSTTSIKDCKKHCQFHMQETAAGGDHAGCAANHRVCPTCKRRHWRQDCPGVLRDICAHQSCRAIACTQHCLECGAFGVTSIKKNTCPSAWEADSEAWDRRLSALYTNWHSHLHMLQWGRVDDTNADIKGPVWSTLRCKHDGFEATADSLVAQRVESWELATSILGTTYNDVACLQSAIETLAAPECPRCFEKAYKPGSGSDFSRRRVGTKTDWGIMFTKAFSASVNETLNITASTTAPAEGGVIT